MSYIWQNDNWPHFVKDIEKLKEVLKSVCDEELKTMSAFSILRDDTSTSIKANMIAEGITASLLIEKEKIDVDSVFSSVAKHLSIKNYSTSQGSAYSDNLVEMISDAFENKSDMTVERILQWQKMLFLNQGGLSKKANLGFRQGSEYVMKVSGKTNEVIYEAVPFERIESEINTLLDYINNSEDNHYIKAAVVSLWFVLIHPLEDGNGRISRALSDYVLLKNSNETLPVLCLSAGILNNKKGYYRQIELTSSQSDSLDITGYVEWFLNVISQCYITSREQLSKTVSVSAFLGSLDPSEFNSREFKMLYMFAAHTFKGKVTNDKWTKITKCSSTVAFRDIQHLVNCGFLIPSGETGPKTGYYFNENAMES